MFLLIIGMVAFAGGVYIALENASISRKQIQTNTKRASSYAMIDPGNEEISKSANERLFIPMIERFSEIAVRMSPAGKRMEAGVCLRACDEFPNQRKRRLGLAQAKLCRGEESLGLICLRRGEDGCRLAQVLLRRTAHSRGDGDSRRRRRDHGRRRRSHGAARDRSVAGAGRTRQGGRNDGGDPPLP